ncbi:MAG: hypothetical protein WCK82_15740, partial [Bacteroidota bacterium]
MKNKLPKYWVVQRDESNPNWKKVIAYLNQISEYNWQGDAYLYYGTERNDEKGVNCYNNLYSFHGNPTVLTIEEFMELTEEKLETTVKIERKQLQVIYDIACSDWKVKIEGIAQGQPFGDEIELTESQVDEMFKAATATQLPVLVDIFGKQSKELDFRVDIDTIIDDLKIFGDVQTPNDQAFIVLPHIETEEDKNKFYLNPNYNWELVD